MAANYRAQVDIVGSKDLVCWLKEHMNKSVSIGTLPEAAAPDSLATIPLPMLVPCVLGQTCCLVCWRITDS